MLAPFVQLIAGGVGLTLAGAMILVRRSAERRRRERYAEYGLTHGLTFDADCQDPRTRIGDGLELFRRGSNHEWRNAFSGSRGGVPFTAFEFRFLGGGRGRGWHDTAVMLWERPGMVWHDFVVAPEDPIDKVLQLFGTQDIDFSEDKAFSTGYRLQGSNEAAVRQLFSPAVRAFCLSHPGMYAAAYGHELIWWREESLPDPAYLDQFIAEGDAFRQLLFK